MATAGLSATRWCEIARRTRASYQLPAAALARPPRRRRRIVRRRTAPAHIPASPPLQVREAQIRLYHNRQRAQLKDHLRAMTGRSSTKVGTDQLMLAAQLAKLPLPEQVSLADATPRRATPPTLARPSAPFCPRPPRLPSSPTLFRCSPSPYADKHTLSRDGAGAAQEVDWHRFQRLASTAPPF